MRHITTALLAVLTLACSALADAGPTISQFLKIRVPGGIDLAPDGTVYTRDWPDGIFQLYRRPAGAPLTEQGRKLTSYEDGLSGYSIAPDGKWITLAYAKGGNENNQIALMDPATGQITPVLENPKVQHSVNLWLRDSSGFIYTANDPSPRDFYIYRYDFKSKSSTPLLKQEGQWFASDITNDNSRLLVRNYRSISDSSIFELDAATGKLTDLTVKPEGGTASNANPTYLPDEQAILFASDHEDGIVQLYRRDLAGGAPVKVFPELARFDLDGGSMNHERTFMVTVHNEDGYGNMRAYKLPSMDPVALPPIERGVIGVADIEGSVLAYSLNNARTPGITFTVDLKNPSAAKPITARLDTENVDLSGFRLPELVKYTSFDGLEIPAFLYLPEGAKRGTPIPFIAHFHGGPEGQFRPTFDRTVQYLVSQGYGVIQPNVRGSTGYGREFHMMDNYKNRWNSVKDGVEAAKWLIREGWAEKGRIAAYGGSYGGFMSVATVIEGGDVFGACINVVGIVNMKTFLEQTSGYRQKLREVEYGPLTDPEFLKSVSSIHRLDEIKVPMMIAHGANDPRVPLNEAIQLAVGLQKRGYDPEILFFHDEGHGFAKLENRILFNERMVKFLDLHIGKDAKR